MAFTVGIYVALRVSGALNTNASSATEKQEMSRGGSDRIRTLSRDRSCSKSRPSFDAIEEVGYTPVTDPDTIVITDMS